MKLIKFNGKTVKLYATEIDCLRTIKANKFAAKLSEFTRGRGVHQNPVLPPFRSRMKFLGLVRVHRLDARGPREHKFFAKNPRCRYGVFGNSRRVNALLKQLEIAEAAL